MFLRKKETQPDSDEFLPGPIVDDPGEVLRKTLNLQNFMVESFLSNVNVLIQYELLKALSDPGLNNSTISLTKNQCVWALIASAQLIHTRYESAEPPHQKTIYISWKDHELLIMIDSGASFPVTPNLDDFVRPIKPFEWSLISFHRFSWVCFPVVQAMYCSG